LVRSQGQLARAETGEAPGRLEEAAGQYPQAVASRVLLARLLGQHAQDHDAERAWREVLTLDPDHAEARTRLAALSHDQGPAV
jgi:hypothetical protein